MGNPPTYFGDEIPLMMEREAGAPEALVSAILVGFGMMQEYHEGESRKALSDTLTSVMDRAFEREGDIVRGD